MKTFSISEPWTHPRETDDDVAEQEVISFGVQAFQITNFKYVSLLLTRA